MKSLLPLFSETRQNYNDTIPKKYQKRIERDCRYINSIDNLPKLSYPKIGSKEHNSDVEQVIFYYANPSMNNTFLNMSNNSVEDCFKVFSKEMGLNINWKHLSLLLDDTDTIVLKLKFAHARPRPKHLLQNESELYCAIKDSNTPSYPSGHTAIAYFTAAMIGNAFPEVKMDAETLAEMIAQSRIENGMHYPSDISAGKMIGQMLADSYISSKSYEDACNTKIKKSDVRKFVKDLISKSTNNNLYSDFAYFLKKTNEIENIDIPYDDCVKCAKKVLQCYPVKYCTDNIDLLSTLKMLIKANSLTPLDNPFKIINLHKCINDNVLVDAAPGEIRNFDHKSPAGITYTAPDLIYREINNFCSNENDPFLRHALFEYIHPFADGNGRLGRVILCSDLNFNFAKTNKLISNNYIRNLNICFDHIIK